MKPTHSRTQTRLAILFALVCAPAALATGAPDIEAGRRSFNACRPCHQIGEGAHNLIGPVLNGVVGRPAGTFPGYSYSAANRNSGLIWTEQTIREYLRDPRAMVPGTKMIFAGFKSDREIDDVVAYIESFDAKGNKVVP